VKAQKLWESVGRPKAKDYDDVTQEILSVAIAVYRCLISTDTPFPDHSKELEFVKIAWNVACKKVGLKLEMTPELVKMVCIHYNLRQYLTGKTFRSLHVGLMYVANSRRKCVPSSKAMASRVVNISALSRPTVSSQSILKKATSLYIKCVFLYLYVTARF
jgi:hypothetical protein